jgi:hypothetical protein
MNLDFNLDFFYYQKQIILDGEDPIFLENLKHEIKFWEYTKQASVEDIIELIVFVYAKKYAINQWYSAFSDKKNVDSTYPEGLDPELDLYLSQEQIASKYVKSFACKHFDDPEQNTFFVEWIRLEFVNPQQLEGLVQAIIRGLKGVNYTESNEGGLVVFNIQDSPISKIEITSTSFRIDFNPDKWIAYYGM